MNTARLVEALAGGVVWCDEAEETYPQIGLLRAWAQGPSAGVPIQWLLLTLDLPEARGLLRHAACALLQLLDVAEVAWTTDAIDGCGKFRALWHAPTWLLAPTEPDDRDEDVALVLERDNYCQGNWYLLLEALHRAGSGEWQWAIQRCRHMMRFEALSGLDVAEVLRVRPTRQLPATATTDPGEDEGGGSNGSLHGSPLAV